MIKFFRKIRQNLLSEGKTGKYFKYAIGEIILVVIGILIALQINNWNENRKNRKLEQDYYCRILEDFQLTQELIQQSNIAVTQQIENGKKLIIDLYKSNKTRETILNDWLKVIRLQKFVPSDASYQDLIASGNLKLFKDVELKNSLAIYYTNLDNILTQLNQNRDKIVESSFQLKPAEFGIQELAYLKASLGEEIMTLLPENDWVHDSENELFKKFQNDLILNIALFERHKQHMNRIVNEMERPFRLLKDKCENIN
jgi:mRNA-degrading endonuclease YafQ of YafQ-DinJ toxin-antitoxin module